MLNDRASMGAFHLVPLPGGDPLTGPPAYTSCRKLQRFDFCELSLRLSWAFWLIQSLLSHLWSPTHTPVNNFWNSLAYYIGFERIVILLYFWFSICSEHMLAHIFSEKFRQWNLIRCRLLNGHFATHHILWRFIQAVVGTNCSFLSVFHVFAVLSLSECDKGGYFLP